MTEKQVYQKWWFWAIITVVFLTILGALMPNSLDNSSSSVSTPSVSTIPTTTSNAPTTTISKSWHIIKTFSGTSDKITDTFSIQGSKFRVIYTVNPANEYSTFYLTIYEEGNSFLTKMFSLDSGTETSIIYNGPGTFYLDIGATNLNSWTIKIEDYY